MVRDLGPIIESFVLLVLHPRQDSAFRRTVTSELSVIITRDKVQSLEEFAEKSHGCLGIAIAEKCKKENQSSDT